MESSDRVRVGQPATTRVENLEAAALALAPHRSLERIESTGRFLLGTVGVVGALITGFGVLDSSTIANHVGWLLPSLIAAAFAMGLALFAAIGTGDSVQVDDLEDVDRYYSSQIRQRGRLIRLAGLALAASLLLALIPAAESGGGSEDGAEAHSFFAGFVAGASVSHLLNNRVDGRYGPAASPRSRHVAHAENQSR